MTNPLTQKLQAKLLQDQQMLSAAQAQAAQDVQRQTAQLLQQHERSLRKLSSDALSTTARATESHHAQLFELQKSLLKRLRWLLMWPLAASAALSILIILVTLAWTWHSLDQLAHQEVSMRQQIRQLEMEFCQTPAGQRVCRKAP